MKSYIEALESRIAPAAFTYFDIDGDRVTITTTSVTGLGTPPEFLNVGDEVILSSGSRTVPGQLLELDLRDPDFAGTRVLFTVQKRGDGDGFADVGFINAEGIDLGKVVVAGDLGRIVAGNN